MSFEQTSNPQYSEFIALSKYARWLPEKNRRENWKETVDRYINFFDDQDDKREVPQLDRKTIKELKNAIFDLRVMPSMRALMTAGAALERDNVAGFNCAYRHASGSGESLEVLTPEMVFAGIETPVSIMVTKPIAFDEIMYILMCGTGVGFSCERQVIANLPIVGHKCARAVYRPTDENFPGVSREELSYIQEDTVYVVDSKYGWASALRILIVEMYNGNFRIKWDLSEVRPAGAPLKTFGGRASGPEPLDDLFRYIVKLFSSCHGRKLTSIEVHGLVCKIAEIVVVGGVRRSALISLSNLSDDRMRHAKSGNWFYKNPEFSLANNSIAYSEKPDMMTFLREWTALGESNSGERGIFNREASYKQAQKNGRRIPVDDYGTNPCSEIILQNQQFCNLSEIIARDTDDLNDLREKTRLATILGTLQATLTNFKYLNASWKINTEAEALLGVSITGIMDHPVLNGSQGGEILKLWLEQLRRVAIKVNKEWAEKLGIKHAAAITCVKPSGTVSQLTDTASGIHPRYSEYYIRTVRADKKDPLAKMMIDLGFPYAKDAMNPDNTLVFSFPMQAPHTAVFRHELTAIDQLEHWLVYQRYWCEHKPSITVYYTEEEFMDVGAWVWDHFDELSGVSFLPYDNGTYKQAPYQEITEKEYEDWLEIFPHNVDWSYVSDYESQDNTIGSQTMACTGGACEIVDLIK
jgi:ribonucleoside-diphosphate reductase alpha chain